MEIKTLNNFYTISFRLEALDASITWRMDSRDGERINGDDVISIMMSLFGIECLRRLTEFASVNDQKMSILVWDSETVNCVWAEFDQDEEVDTSDFEESYSPEEAKFGRLHYCVVDLLDAFYLQRDSKEEDQG